LQWTREGLREFPYPIVLWVTPRILRQISVKAPDFWSWRTGVFRFIAPVFTSTSAIPDRTVPSSFDSDRPTDLPIDELLEQVAQIEARNPQSPALATLYDRLGQAYEQKNTGDRADNRKQAIEYFQRSIQIPTTRRSTQLNTLTRLGNLYRKLGDYNEAEALHLKCLDIETELGDRAGIASLWGALGDIAHKRGDYDKAESLYLQSLELYTELGDRAGIANSWGLLGDIARNRGDYDKSESLYLKCLDIETELGDRAGIASSWGCLGENELRRGELAIAEMWLKKALPVMEELQMT
jgi:tetratricopeptide (TPR) repeat protein